ncbi:MAG TPA: phosphate ABC transporter permease PstA [Ferrovibrio sp.]|nr:phosphate ABC transporter permease PstA [Ferrovibrio sp.]HLT76703.1 phosphate ABC transporter permease PstA [Ferrovibrio sp.]
MTERAAKRLKARYAAERRFRLIGLSAILFSLLALVLLLGNIVSNGFTAFRQTHIRLNVEFSAQHIAPAGTTDFNTIMQGNYGGIILAALQERFPEVQSRGERRRLQALISAGAEPQLARMVAENPALIGTRAEVWLPASSDIDMFVKEQVDTKAPEEERRVKDNQVRWIDALKADGDLELQFNTRFFTGADSREPELVGILGGVVGSIYTLLVCLAVSFPLGIMAAIYLEEFAPKNRFTEIIEVNINNLAAVPSIVYGLLGLAVFIGFFGLPRSAPFVGGLVLALMSLPVIIIAARAALRAVPPSIRHAALGVGASPLQAVMHHVLPLAMPGILTGTIIAMAHALGETAPLLMIGMVAFIVDIPATPVDAATVLPVQIFMWADSPERGFVEKTSAAIIVLLVFLLLMNLTAILLRKKFERRW